MGLKLHATFIKAGYVAPKLSVQAPAGAGAEHPVYAAAAEFVRTVLPALEAPGVATAREVDVETLASRIDSGEAVYGGSHGHLVVAGRCRDTEADRMKRVLPVIDLVRGEPRDMAGLAGRPHPPGTVGDGAATE